MLRGVLIDYMPISVLYPQSHTHKMVVIGNNLRNVAFTLLFLVLNIMTKLQSNVFKKKYLEQYAQL